MCCMIVSCITCAGKCLAGYAPDHTLSSGEGRGEVYATTLSSPKPNPSTPTTAPGNIWMCKTL